MKNLTISYFYLILTSAIVESLYHSLWLNGVDLTILSNLSSSLTIICIFLSFSIITGCSLKNYSFKSPLVLIPLLYICMVICNYITLNSMLEFLDIQHLGFGKPFDSSIFKDSKNTILLNKLLFPIIKISVGIFSLRWFRKHNVFFEQFTNRSIFINFFYTSINVSFIVTCLVFFQLQSMYLIVQDGSRGYIKLNSQGLVLTEKVYSKDNLTVRLVPMVHIANKDFYKEIATDIDDTKTLFLMEGVSDKNKLVKNFSYKKISKAIGLDEQGDHFKIDEKENVSIIVADLDVAELGEGAISYIKEIEVLMNNFNLDNYFNFAKKIESGEFKDVYFGLIEKRNRHLLKILEEKEKDFQTIIIPWGALHLYDIEKGLTKLGLKDTSLRKDRVLFQILK